MRNAKVTIFRVLSLCLMSVFVCGACGVFGSVADGDGGAGDDGGGVDGSDDHRCVPGTRRCAGDAFEFCDDDGENWVQGENCESGCLAGFCVLELADTEVAGDIIEPGMAVVIRGLVRVRPHADGPDGEAGRVRIVADAISIEGTLDGSGSGFMGGGGGGGGGGGHRHESPGVSGPGGQGSTAGQAGAEASVCGSDKYGGPGGSGGQGGGASAARAERGERATHPTTTTQANREEAAAGAAMAGWE